HHVRPQQRAERPSLQVRALQRSVEEDAISRPSKTVSELDVFDGGMSKAVFVEAADLLEDAPADRATSGPEGRCLALAIMVPEMVQEGLVARHEAPGRRVRITGAEH